MTSVKFLIIIQLLDKNLVTTLVGDKIICKLVEDFLGYFLNERVWQAKLIEEI